MKAKISQLNCNTRWKTVNGLKMTRIGTSGPCKITIRVTSDERGKSLSLEDGTTMLMIPLEPVADLLTVAFDPEGTE